MANPPTGTLTFLFTDIEGSTKLWEDNAPAMQAALARHDELIRRAIEERGGYVFKTVGEMPSAVPSEQLLMPWKLPWRLSVGSSLRNGRRLGPLG